MVFEDFQSNEYDVPVANADVSVEEPQVVEPRIPELKQPKGAKKKVRLLLDIRTELTDKELRDAKSNYLQEQARLRSVLEQERLNKEIAEKAHNMIFEPPSICGSFEVLLTLSNSAATV